MRRLPGPAVCRLSEGANTPEALYELFRDWQRTPTQSSATALVARGSQWMSGSAKSRNHPPRGTSAHDDTCHHALRVLANAPGTSLPPLTEDSHGCRLYGHLAARRSGQGGLSLECSVSPVIRPKLQDSSPRVSMSALATGANRELTPAATAASKMTLLAVFDQRPRHNKLANGMLSGSGRRRTYDHCANA
jgi:hypothetical protein